MPDLVTVWTPRPQPLHVHTRLSCTRAFFSFSSLPLQTRQTAPQSFCLCYKRMKRVTLINKCSCGLPVAQRGPVIPLAYGWGHRGTERPRILLSVTQEGGGGWSVGRSSPRCWPPSSGMGTGSGTGLNRSPTPPGAQAWQERPPRSQ